jgi:hypothetical protein
MWSTRGHAVCSSHSERYAENRTDWLAQPASTPVRLAPQLSQALLQLFTQSMMRRHGDAFADHLLDAFAGAFGARDSLAVRHS